MVSKYSEYTLVENEKSGFDCIKLHPEDTSAIFSLKGEVAEKIYFLLAIQERSESIPKSDIDNIIENVNCHKASLWTFSLIDYEHFLDREYIYGDYSYPWSTEKRTVISGYSKPIGFQVYKRDILQHSGVVTGYDNKKGQPVIFEKEDYGNPFRLITLEECLKNYKNALAYFRMPTLKPSSSPEWLR